MIYFKKEKKFAFSLAEAMVTLLIVSLIAIASIPVLTKKKRDVTSSEHGKWMCTTNSNYDYVVWSSVNASGDVSNPDTWEKAGNSGYTDSVNYYDEAGRYQYKVRNRCMFVPPSSAKVRNFNVTVIGNGGGGHDGAANYKSLLTQTNAGGGSFIPRSEISDYYDIIVIGAGGGGGGSAGDGDSGPGGGGGGGAMFKGHIKLVKNATYSFYVAGGGAGNSGRYHGGLSNSTSHGRADGGGTSNFTGNPNGQNVNIQVPGGQGGDATGCSKWKCRGGDHGAGAGSSGITRTFPSATGNTSAVSSGADGGYGQDYCKWPRGWTPGGSNSFESFQTNTNNLPLKITYGSGGSGFYGCDGGNGQTGGSGAVIISQTEQLHGEGGKAGTMDSRFVPSIEGSVLVNIPMIANQGQSGGSVIAELIKNKTQNGILKQQAGGAGGGTNTTGPTNGENSPWTYNGGGVAGDACTNVSNITGGYYPVTKKVLKCKKAVCVVDDYDQEYLKANPTIIANGVPITIAPKTVFNSNWEMIQDASLPIIPLSGTTLASLLSYMGTNGIPGPLDLNKLESIKYDLYGYDNYSDFANQACYKNGSYLSFAGDCEVQEYADKTEQVWKDTQRSQTCPAAGNGTAFGAGGGGGRAGDLNGVFGKGGKGGAGAVIIEW